MIGSIAIEVKDEETANIVRSVFPVLADVSLETIFGHFLVFNPPGTEPRQALTAPANVHEYFDHIENARTIMLKCMVGKD